MPAPTLFGDYAAYAELEDRWRDRVARLGGTETIAGRSVEGRPLWRFQLGARDPAAPAIFITALIHGVEVIGSVALFEAFRAFGQALDLLETNRVVLMPMVNPDACARNMDRLVRGKIAYQRRNARGVDLNRNFPAALGARSWHPFSGSSLRVSPHYRGPHPLSEPESRAVAEVAAEVRPHLALGFHSFGNMVLFPWAHSRQRHPAFATYQRLGDAFARGAAGSPYRVRQAIDFYPTVGDLDDWLDATFGTLAFTVEVGALDRRLLHPLRLINPFCWMNPTAISATAAHVAPGMLGLLRAAR
jgi:predicted deacylase